MTPDSLVLHLIGAFATALILSLVGTYLVRGWAIRRGYVDIPNDARRIHSDPTPNVGGVAIVFATAVSFAAWSFVVVPDSTSRLDILAMLGGGILTFLVGFRDDTHPMRAGTKFGLQAVIASLAFLAGVRIMGVGFGSVWWAQVPLLLGFLITTVWIVGTTNAFNLIDGSDGVAGGAAMFASLSLAIIFILNGDPLGALMATVIVAACIGFLFFNFPPASIFMGDCGSLFLGYTLATLAVITTHKSTTLLAIGIPLIAFAVPLLDTTIAIVRRFLRHQPIFAPDRGHIHHRLRDLGHSSRGVAILLYVACAGCASLSLLLAAPGRTTALPVLFVAGLVLVLAVQRLKVPELTELTRAVGRSLQQRQVISHNVRMYALSEELERARTFNGIINALDTAFRPGEFARAEVWVPSALAGQVDAEDGRVSLKDHPDGVLVNIEFEHALHPEQEIEVRVPLWVAGRSVGRLSLYRTIAGERLYTDLRLVARQLGPALVKALTRVAGRAELAEVLKSDVDRRDRTGTGSRGR